MDCIGWEGTYDTVREINGSHVNQRVTEYLVTTEHGLVHFKICSFFSGKMKVFTDLDVGFKIRTKAAPSQEQVKKHQQWSRMRRAAVANGSNISYVPYGTVEEMYEHRDLLQKALVLDEKARNAWNCVLGIDTDVRLQDIMAQAEQITAEQREVRMREKALEMAAYDDTYGMF